MLKATIETRNIIDIRDDSDWDNGKPYHGIGVKDDGCCYAILRFFDCNEKRAKIFSSIMGLLKCSETASEENPVPVRTLEYQGRIIAIGQMEMDDFVIVCDDYDEVPGAVRRREEVETILENRLQEEQQNRMWWRRR